MRGAGQVEQRGGRQVLRDAKCLLVDGVGVIESVPEGGSLAEQRAAADVIPVILGVLHAGNSLIPVDTGERPTSLRNPDLLAAGNTNGRIVRRREQSRGILDGVALAVLVVGILVDTKPVNVVNDGAVGSVGPGIPGINVPNRDAGQGSVGKRLLVVLDEADNDVGTSANAGLVGGSGHAVTVQVLAADGNTDDEVGEVIAVLLNALLQSTDLVVDVGRARRPNAEEKVSLGLDGGTESLDGVVGRVGLDVGVESEGVEVAGSALEVLGSRELLGEVGLELGRVVRVGRGRVEAEPVLGSGHGGQGAQSESGSGAHGDSSDQMVRYAEWSV